VISQSSQIHELIQKLLTEDLRESLGQQVSIEARFLFVTENFLEDIGMGVSAIRIKSGAIMDKLGQMNFQFGSASNTAPQATTIEGSLAPVTPAVNLVGGVQYGSVLDDLQVSFFLQAVQSHKDSKVLTAPRVTVLSGESAYIRVVKETAYVSNYTFEDITASGSNQPTRTVATATTAVVGGGVVLNVTPTISADKKYVSLLIGTNFTKTDLIPFDVFSGTTGQAFPISLPTSEISEVQTRVNVPDCGTLLIGGQKLGAEVNQESGVPGLSKVPIIGRLFSSRSQVKDQDVLLVLVKPTIILQQEAEREYFAPLEE
jgi:type II secretory pathway component GspD/PulD (secretin)